MQGPLPLTVAILILVTLILSQRHDPDVAGTSARDPHFTSNSDGTVADNWSNLVWLRNADCIGETTWKDAVDLSRRLADGVCGLTDGSSPGDWRVPYRSEVKSLFDPGNFSPVLPAGNPFLGIRNSCYWVAGRGQDGHPVVGYLYIGDGGAGLGGIFVCQNQYHRGGGTRFLLLPVRSGKVVRNMKKCTKCRQPIPDGDEKRIHGSTLCEDCTIDEAMPKMPKAHYDNDAEFMQRLKGSYSVRRQQFH